MFWDWSRLHFIPRLEAVAVMMPPVRYCIPREYLCNLQEGSLGSYTYTQQGNSFSSLSGYMTKSRENHMLPVLSMMTETESQLLPDMGAFVICKVSSIKSHFAKVHILYVRSTVLKNAFKELFTRKISELLMKTRLKFEFQPRWHCFDQNLSRWHIAQLLPDHCWKWAGREGWPKVNQMSRCCEMQCPKIHTKEFQEVT